jgi:phenylalanyl-tRNA synthetase beta chain
MALIVDQGIRHEDIVSAIRQAAPEELEQVSLFDIFEGQSIGSGKKSMAYSLTYRSSTRTLTDEEANAYHNNVKKALGSALSVEFRER